MMAAAGLIAAGCGDEVTDNTSGAGGSAGDASTSATGGNTGSGGDASTGAGGDASAGAGGDVSTGSGGGQETMGATQQCQECVALLYSNDQDCAATIQTCDNDPACNDWKNCNEDCFNDNDTPACYAACDDGYPHDTALSAPLMDCTCDACEAVCPASCS
jgi:hypothetical protein